MPRLSLHPAHRALVLTSALALACGDSSSAESTTGSETSTDPATTSTGGPTGTSTGEPTTASEPTSTTGEPTTASEPTSTTGEPMGTSGELTTGTSTTSSTSTTADTTTSDTTGGLTDLVLDPATLVFFDLPINSVRHAVGGFDPDQQTCVSIVFFGDIDTQQCDNFQTGDEFGFPYVVVTPDAAPPCMDWDYAGNVTLDAASGCVVLTSQNPLDIAIDMTLTVSGAPFTGTITVAHP